MLQKDNRTKILEIFFKYPLTNFQIRELSRKTNIALPSTSKYLKELEKNKLILREQKGLYPSYKANRDHKIFQIYKATHLVKQLHESGLIDYISNKTTSDCIVLFGSCVIGEDVETSDIDLFVQANDQILDLSKWEKEFARKINIFYKEYPKKLSSELKNNLSNGIVLEGYCTLI